MRTAEWFVRYNLDIPTLISPPDHRLVGASMTVLPMDALLASFFMQSALATVFLAALWGFAFVYRRPLHRALAIGWSIYIVHTLASMLSAWYGRSAPLSSVRWHTATAQLVAVTGSAAFWYASVRILSGRQHTLRPSTPTLLVLGGAAASLVLASVVTGTVLHQPGSGPLGALYPLLYITLVVLVVRELRATTQHHRELIWLGVGFALLATRLLLVTLVIMPESQFRDATLTQLLAVATVQLVQIVAMGIISIGVAAVYERTAVLAQAARLYEAELKVQRNQRLEALGRMAAGIAHDFNNVLLVIGGGVELAGDALRRLNGAATESVQRELIEMQAAVRQGGGLTARLLAYARPSSAPAVGDVGTEIDVIVSESAPLLTKSAGAARRLIVDTSAAGMRCALDRTQIEQLLLNLVVNARDATASNGTITVRTRVERVTTPRIMHQGLLATGSYARLSVEDDGAGIPPDVLPHIMEPFFTTKQDQGGTGIGLATVQQIVVATGGEVDVTSTVGIGTRIDLYLTAQN